MILTTHIISGAALGAGVKNPYIVAGLAVVLHFLLDLFPHGDYLNKKSTWRDYWKVVVDLTVGFSIVLAALFLSNKASTGDLNLKNVGIGIFFSLLPDGTTLLYIMKIKFLKPLKEFHEGLHYYQNGSPQREFRLKNEYWEIGIVLISILVLIFLR